MQMGIIIEFILAGMPTGKQTINLSLTMPAMNTAQFVWACLGNMDSQKLFSFSLMVKKQPIHEAKSLAAM